MELKWHGFQMGDQQGWHGMADAGIHTFTRDKMGSFIREMFQNSNDARRKNLPEDEPVRIKIRKQTVDGRDIPDMEGFIDILRKVERDNPDDGEFFNRLRSDLTDGRRVRMLSFEDYGTKGLELDRGEEKKSFTALVHAEGLSVQKSSTAGGAYGIGKNAIFQMSKARTVIFSSYNDSDGFLFQGVTRLASHKVDGIKMERVLNLSAVDGGEHNPLRNTAFLSEGAKSVFGRSEQGLSQFVLYPFLEPDWMEDMAKAVIRNYWYAIMEGRLEVNILDDNLDEEIVIGSANIEELAHQFFMKDGKLIEEREFKDDPEGNPLQYMWCLKKGITTEFDLPDLGTVILHLAEGPEWTAKKIAYLRNGMVITAHNKDTWGYGGMSFCGVIRCKDDKGNAMLRKMENPAHTEFSADSFEERHPGGKAKAKEALTGIRNMIKGELKKIRDQQTLATEEIPEVEDWFTGVADEGAGGAGTRSNRSSRTETPHRMIRENVKGQFVFSSEERNEAFVTDENGQVIAKGGGGGAGTGGGGITTGPGKRKKGKNPKGGGPYDGNNTRKSPLPQRIFIASTEDSGHSKYIARLGSTGEGGPTSGNIVIAQLGDSGRSATFKLIKASDSDSREEHTIEEMIGKDGDAKGYLVRNVNFPAVIELVVEEAHKSSFIISRA